MKPFVHVQRSIAMSDFGKSSQRYKKFDVPIVSVFVNIGMRSSNGARDATKNSRHSVQVVYTTRVMGLGVFRQEWLQKRRTSMWSKTYHSKIEIDATILFSILRHGMNYQYLLSGMRIPQCSVLRQSNQSKELPTDWLTCSTLFPRQHHRREWHSEREPKDKKEIISEHLAFTIWCSSQFSHFLAQDVVLKLWRDFRFKKSLSLTMLNLHLVPSLWKSGDSANVVTQAAANEKYVLMTERCCAT